MHSFTEQEKDTRAADMSEHTYIPQSKTFEMDLMEHYRLEWSQLLVSL